MATHAFLNNDVILKDAMMHLTNNLVVSKLIDRDFEAEFGGATKVGDTIRIARPIRGVVRTGATFFGSTANGNPSVYMPIANRYYEAVRGWTPQLRSQRIADSNRFHPITDKVRQVDHHGGYTAAAGHALYTARTYPQEYWNRTAFVCEPTGHLVGTFVLSPTAPASTQQFLEPVASDDEWTAPIMAEVGPDGNVWVIDWYNYIVQHNPTPAGFQTRQGRGLRNGPARQEARPHLSAGLRFRPTLEKD